MDTSEGEGDRQIQREGRREEKRRDVYLFSINSVIH